MAMRLSEQGKGIVWESAKRLVELPTDFYSCAPRSLVIQSTVEADFQIITSFEFVFNLGRRMSGVVY